MVDVSAREILESPAMCDVFAALEDYYVKAMINTAPEDKAARDMAHLHHTVLGQVRGHLQSMATTKKLTREEQREVIGKRLLSFR